MREGIRIKGVISCLYSKGMIKGEGLTVAHRRCNSAPKLLRKTDKTSKKCTLRAKMAIESFIRVDFRVKLGTFPQNEIGDAGIFICTAWI